MEISRKKLIKTAFKAIAATKKPVTDSDRAHMLYAACTMKETALNAWTIGPTCGCLVGSMLQRERGPVANDKVVDVLRDNRSALVTIGNEFNDLLKDELAKHYDSTLLNYGHIKVTVTD